eukprot:TRINITY_DN202_c0_g1_i1.p1 TRINITY_DN202_c0_g1~~TRINITY_DN202_c0_g1_i1.p1  ORF type:complete len:527 (-),score=62.75 TRINITY_DN202_c0_g1_i1:945-2525(-)
MALKRCHMAFVLVACLGLLQITGLLNGVQAACSAECTFSLGDSVPFISLDGSPDTGTGPYIMDSATGGIVQVGSTGEGEVLCSSSSLTSTGNQFYAGGQQAQVRFRTFNQPAKSAFENLCILLPLTAVQIGSVNLNPGDGNQALYPDAKRCVVFSTGPDGGCSSTGGVPSTPPTASPAAFSPPAELPPPPPAAPLFPAIFTFGDSVVDVGTTLYLPTSPFVPLDPPYEQEFKVGRFSNGKIVTDYLSDFIGIPTADPFLKPNSTTREYGINFACASSGFLDSTNCGENNTLCIDMTLQLEQFASVSTDYSASVLASSLFFINSGANDFGSYLANATFMAEVPYTTFITNVVDAALLTVGTLYARGARKFLVGGLPAEGCLPTVLNRLGVPPTNASCVPAIELLVSTYNTYLFIGLNATISALPDAYFTFVNTQYALTVLIENPAPFGFNNVTSGCCGSGNFNGGYPYCGIPGYQVCTNPAEHIFWDLLHGTTKVYEILSLGFFNLTGGATPEAWVYPYPVTTLAVV